MDRKTMIRALLPCLALALLVGCATPKAAPVVTAVDLNPKIASGRMVQKVDAFAVIIDDTLSMNAIYKGATKYQQQRDLLNLMNDTIPDLKMKAAARKFGGGYKWFTDPTSVPIFGLQDYNRSLLSQAIPPSPVGQGESPLGAAIDGATADLRPQPGNMALIIFSDGEMMEKFEPVAAAKRMKAEYGDRICIYTVQLGNHLGGAKLLQEVADAGRCGFMVSGDKISTPLGMADFVEKVFLGPKPPEPVKVAPPPPAPVQEMKREAETEVEKVIVEKGRATLLVHFDFDKAVVKPEYDKEIEKMADVMKKYPDLDVVIEGHTCNIGTKAYNEDLSLRRAEAVKEVMVKKFGIDAARIMPKGFGFANPIANNETLEGRQQNRRVEAAVAYVKK